MMPFANRTDHPLNTIHLMAGVLVLFLSIALQIQGDISDIRLNLADPILPIAGLFIIISLILKKSIWPQWNIPYAYLWLAGLSVLMVVSCINSYVQTGALSSWALYNKLVGFIVLICYFAMGGWIARNRDQTSFAIFLSGFLLSFLALYFFAFVSIIAYTFDVEGALRFKQFAGFMGNRNAYSVLLICVTTFLVVVHRCMPDFLPRYIVPAFFVCLPFIAGSNGSRAGWIVLVLVALYFMVTEFKWFVRRVMPFLLCGVIIAALLFTMTDQSISKRKQIKRIQQTIAMLEAQGTDVLQDVSKEEGGAVRKLASEMVRIRNAGISLEIWKENPIIGGGLGAILQYQYAHYDPEKVYIDVMDSTPLWLLAETGLVGFLAFVAFYGFILRALWRKMKGAEGVEAVFAEALFVFMLAFGIMSIFHEIMYTRYLWVMMGMGAASLRPQVATS